MHGNHDNKLTIYKYNAIICLIKDFILAHLYMETMILQGIWVTGISIAMCPLLHCWNDMEVYGPFFIIWTNI